MFLPYLIRFIKGFVRFEIRGKNTINFLNSLIKKDIFIWNTSKIKNKFYTNTSIKNYILLHKSAKEKKVKLKIIERNGLPFIINRYKHRLGILIGFISFILFLITMSQFIWVIEVHGNKKIDNNQLIKFISQKNIFPGKYRKNIDVKPIEQDILLNFKNISWISINIQGSKATIEINEQTPPPQNWNNGAPCNIVASKKGIIKHVEAYSGQNLVDIDDLVNKGQLIVSGIIEDKSLNNTLVRANAKVIAQVEEIIRYSQPLTEEITKYNTISTNLYLEIFNKNIPLNFTKKATGNIKTFQSVVYPKIFNVSLPFNIRKCYNKQPLKIPINLPLSKAKAKLLKKIAITESKMNKNNIKITSKKIIGTNLIDQKYTIDIKYTTEEDIAQPQEIILDDISNSIFPQQEDENN